MIIIQIVGISILLMGATIAIIKLIEKNKQDFLKEMYKRGDISEDTFKKYLN